MCFTLALRAVWWEIEGFVHSVHATGECVGVYVCTWILPCMVTIKMFSKQLSSLFQA